MANILTKIQSYKRFATDFTIKSEGHSRCCAPMPYRLLFTYGLVPEVAPTAAMFIGSSRNTTLCPTANIRTIASFSLTST